MRGTRIASSISDQRATNIAYPVGQRDGIIRPYNTHALTVGSAASLRGYRPQDHSVSQFGALQPDTWASERIFELTAHVSTDAFVLTFSTEAGQQLTNVATLLVTISGFKGSQLAPFDAAFSTGSYRATVAGLGAYLDANLNGILAVRFGRRA